jgi:hypothetical protein
MDKPKLVTGLFKSRTAAEAAVDALLKHGFTRDDISVLMSDATHTKEFGIQARTHAADGLGHRGCSWRRGRRSARSNRRSWHNVVPAGDQSGDRRSHSPRR